jgi:5'-methylthioadenosine phosphorylase
MMKKRKIGIIGGSGLYKIDGFEKTKWIKIKTSWGSPSDEILTANLGSEEVCFLPRHSNETTGCN